VPGRDDCVLARDESRHCWPSQKCRNNNACEHPEVVDDVGELREFGSRQYGCWLLGVTNCSIPRRKGRPKRFVYTKSLIISRGQWKKDKCLVHAIKKIDLVAERDKASRKQQLL
jgi:hypothetical protein